MATHALCRGAMLAPQGVFGLVVIEQDFFPIPLGMAGLAFRPEIALMFIVLGVARLASHLQFILVQVPLVTTDTFCRGAMLAQQRIFRLLVMIEQDFFPVPLGVA